MSIPSRSRLLQRLELPPCLSRRDLWLTIIPFLAWLALVQARPFILKTHCGPKLENCPSSQVLPMDQPGLGVENGPADGYSYFTQNFSGVLTFVVPAIYQGSLVALGQVSPATALMSTAVD